PLHDISAEVNIDENPKVVEIILEKDVAYLEKDFILIVKSQDLNLPRYYSCKELLLLRHYET
ncbi:174_t:CDS:1, partial [Acaulospora morrowiae]